MSHDAAGWEDAVGLVAYVFHFSPSAIWNMELDDLVFWTERALKFTRNHG